MTSGLPRKPLLLVDIDGVISLFARNGRFEGAPSAESLSAQRERPDSGAGAARTASVKGSFHSIDGMLHYLSATAAAHLLALESCYELVWASGWEEKAGEHLPQLLGLPSGMPYLRFARGTARAGTSMLAHWKLEAVDAYAGDRALAWIDDAFNDACRAWARARNAPTLLIDTEPERGLTDREAQRLRDWAQALAGG
jgi:hypothetical protein